MIPKIIWQTYEDPYDKLEDSLKELTISWKKINPDWEYRYMSSSERENFIIQNFGKDWLDIYLSCPIKTMQSNIWRYMVAYVYGGLYVDLDTVCNKPIEEWIDINLNLLFSVDTLDKTYYAQFAFASSKNNEVLKFLLDKIKEKFLTSNLLEDTKKLSSSKLSYSYTGTEIWTNSINSFFKLQKKAAEINSTFINLKTKNHGAYCYAKNEEKFFNGYGMTHFGSGDWSNNSYVAFGKKIEKKESNG